MSMVREHNPLKAAPAFRPVDGVGDRRSEVVVLDRARRAAARQGQVDSQVIRVVIADGRSLVRAGIRVLLDGGERIAVVAEATTGEEAVAVARHTRPDVVVLDARLPGVDGIEATHRITTEVGSEVILLTDVDSDEQIFTALRAGARGLLLKDTPPSTLVRAVEVLSRGEAFLSPSLTRRLISEYTSKPPLGHPSADGLEELTKREREVMSLVALGLSNGEIAEHLVVSPATARTHVSRAMVKLRARDRAQLVVFAYESGIATPQRTGGETQFAR